MTIAVNASSTNVWSEATHQEQLKKGWSSHSIHQTNANEKIIHIDRMQSSGAGFGTATYREMMKLSLKEGNCKVETHAAVSSHLFHLYMGMAPIDRAVSIAENKYGDRVFRGIQELEKVQATAESDKDVSSLDPDLLYMLGTVLAKELNKPFASITVDTVLENKCLLTKLLEERCSYICDVFITKLIECLKEPGPVPQTNSLGTVKMVMSEEGRKRWYEAIKQNEPFAPFKNLEHLHSKMTSDQIEEINTLVSLRPSIPVHRKPSVFSYTRIN